MNTRILSVLSLFFATGLLFLFVSVSSADAATYYVATTGSDSNSCSQAQNQSTPKRTINNAKNCLSAGSTLIIGSGTYAESITSVPAGTSWTNAVTFRAATPLGVIIRPNAPTTGPLDLQSANYHYVVFDGFIFDGTNADFQAVKLSFAHHIRIQNGEVRNAPVNGIIVSGEGTDFNEFINLEVYNNAVSHGIYIWGANSLVDGCHVHHNGRYGIHFYDSGKGLVNNSIVRNNIVHNNGLKTQSGSLLIGGNGSQVYNNIVYNDVVFGIRLQYSGVQNAKVFNNTVYNISGTGIYITGSNHEVRNNISFNNSGPEIDNQSTGSTLSNNLTTDPSFVNAGAANFHLQSGSPAINAGTSLVSSVVTTDFDGVSRPQGSAYDIGAYEFTSGTAPTVTPTPTSTSTSPDITTGLVGHWSFDNTAQDSSGNANHATLTGSPTYTTGKVGTGALSLNGTSQYAQAPDANTLDLSNPFTLSAWVNPSVALSDFRSILVKNYTYFLYGSVSSYCGAGSVLGGFGGGTVCQASPLPANTWTHLALTYNGSTLALYRNGNPTPVVTASATGTPTNTTGTLQIGASQYGEYFNGKIDDVRVYNRALSGMDIQALYTRIPYTAPQTQIAPTIDGLLSEYADAPAITLTNSRGTSGVYRLLYDTQNLYVSAQVTDTSVNAIHTTRDAALYQDDSIELMLDALHNGGATLQTDDYKFYVNTNNAQADSQGGSISWNSSFTSAAKTNATGYTLEFAIPFSAIGVTPTTDMLVGLDISMNDRDAAGTTLQTAWMNTTGGDFNDPNGWGDLILSSQTVNSPSACHTLDNTQPIPQGYAASYNLFTPQQELLMSATCTPTSTTVTLGNGNMGNPTNWDGRMWVWSEGYELINNTWQPTTYTCTGEQIPFQGGVWCRAQATGTLDAQATAYLGYTCQWHTASHTYKCGCSDTTCTNTTPFWHVQRVQR
jgi:hypothetical protein